MLRFLLGILVSIALLTSCAHVRVAEAAVATLGTTVSYVGDAVSVNFAVTFGYCNKTDLIVTVAAVTKTYGSDYTVSQLNPFAAGSSLGGTVVMASAPAASAAVVISRSTPKTQPSRYTPTGPLPASTLEKNLDCLTYMAQEAAAGVAGGVTGTGTPPQLAAWANATSLTGVGAGESFAVFDAPQTGAMQASIGLGTTAAPTALKGGVLQIYKISGLLSATGCVNGVDPECGTAMAIEHQSTSTSNAVQITGLNVSAKSVSAEASPGGDAVAIIGRGLKTAGAGLSAGGYFQGMQRSASGSVQGAEVSGTWDQAIPCPYSVGAFPTCIGLHIVANANLNASLQGVGIFVNSAALGVEMFQAGMWFNNGAVGGASSVTIDDRTNTVTSYRVVGNHTTGIDLAGAVFTGAAIKLSAATSPANASILWDSGMILEGNTPSFLPPSDNTGNIGSASKRWNNVNVTQYSSGALNGITTTRSVPCNPVTQFRTETVTGGIITNAGTCA